MVSEACVDAYGEIEERGGFAVMLEDVLALPFTTRVLGLEVRVEAVDLNEADDIVAVCRAGRSRQRIALVDLVPPQPRPAGWEWVEAWRYYLTGRTR
jgi:hypothetical protein